MNLNDDPTEYVKVTQLTFKTSFVMDAISGDDADVFQKKVRRTRNICLFVANIFIVSLLYMALVTYNNGIVRTLERRFGFSSYQTGFLYSCNDIVHLAVVVFIGYFGQKGNIPRIICVTAMFSAISGILTASPHFLFPDNAPNELTIDRVDSQVNTWTDGLNVTDNSNTTLLTTNGQSSSKIGSKYCTQFNLENRSDLLSNHCSKEDSRVHPAFYVFLVSQSINGVGSAAIFTLSLTYIDENSPKSKASIFLGIYTSVYSLGPVFGLLLSSFTLKFPENLLSGTSLSTTDPSFIGCWWLGYLIIGVAMAIFAFLLWFHPRDYNHNRTSAQVNDSRITENLNLSETKQEMKENLFKDLQGLPKALLHLLRNKLYLINLCLIIAGGYTLHAVFIQVVRYLEVHFRRSAAEASILAGLTLALTGAFGGFTGGALISKLKLKTTGGIKLLLVMSLTFGISMMVIINLGCPRDTMVMTMDPVIQANVVINDCNRDCECLTSRKHFQPVCGNNNISYFSPCIAGCSHKINDTFVNCKCIGASSSSSIPTSDSSAAEDGTATSGYCVRYCGLLVPFIVIMFIATFAASIAKVPYTMISLRIVSDDERSFALGINSFVLKIAVFIPGPMIFGKLIDSTCLLWQRTCGTTGACLFFDADRLRKILYGAALLIESLAFLGNVCLFLLIRKKSIGKMSLSRQVNAAEDVDMNL